MDPPFPSAYRQEIRQTFPMDAELYGGVTIAGEKLGGIWGGGLVID
jgi:hypothetical protein